MKKIELYHHHHRFRYLLMSDLLNNSVVHVGKSPIDKTIVLNGEKCIAIVEYTDGAIEQQERECVFFPFKVIETVSKTIDVRKKKKLYFRPLHSKTLSSSLQSFLSNEGWTLESTHPWSYYHGNYASVFQKRNEIRKEIQKYKKNEVVFFGRYNDVPYPKTDHQFANNLLAKRSYFKTDLSHDDIVQRPTRKERIQNFEDAHGIKVKVIDGVSEGSGIFNSIKNASTLLQPHGIAIRHNVYEGMMLGVNSIVETTSYNPQLFNLFHQWSFDKNQMPLSSFTKSSSEELIEYYENYMTPDKIAFEILSKMNEEY